MDIHYQLKKKEFLVIYETHILQYCEELTSLVFSLQ
jgi:hypothetical protein